MKTKKDVRSVLLRSERTLPFSLAQTYTLFCKGLRQLFATVQK